MAQRYIVDHPTRGAWNFATEARARRWAARNGGTVRAVAEGAALREYVAANAAAMPPAMRAIIERRIAKVEE